MSLNLLTLDIIVLSFGVGVVRRDAGTCPTPCANVRVGIHIFTLPPFHDTLPQIPHHCMVPVPSQVRLFNFEDKVSCWSIQETTNLQKKGATFSANLRSSSNSWASSTWKSLTSDGAASMAFLFFVTVPVQVIPTLAWADFTWGLFTGDSEVGTINQNCLQRPGFTNHFACSIIAHAKREKRNSCDNCVVLNVLLW